MWLKILRGREEGEDGQVVFACLIAVLIRRDPLQLVEKSGDLRLNGRPQPADGG